ncbi:hypothetical protein M5K25_015312 [Dendrobium thyrsiflorum]|uniref:Transmembrane protein n=1 Tax=Dendrobium thyrsiflorum TaxID=117978 RepID=A0ABD0UWU1_DENTH
MLCRMVLGGITLKASSGGVFHFSLTSAVTTEQYTNPNSVEIEIAFAGLFVFSCFAGGNCWLVLVRLFLKMLEWLLCRRATQKFRLPASPTATSSSIKASTAIKIKVLISICINITIFLIVDRAAFSLATLAFHHLHHCPMAFFFPTTPFIPRACGPFLEEITNYGCHHLHLY